VGLPEDRERGLVAARRAAEGEDEEGEEEHPEGEEEAIAEVTTLAQDLALGGEEAVACEADRPRLPVPPQVGDEGQPEAYEADEEEGGEEAHGGPLRGFFGVFFGVFFGGFFGVFFGWVVAALEPAEELGVRPLRRVRRSSSASSRGASLRTLRRWIPLASQCRVRAR
jgi:hypothetical protein